MSNAILYDWHVNQIFGRFTFDPRVARIKDLYQQAREVRQSDQTDGFMRAYDLLATAIRVAQDVGGPRSWELQAEPAFLIGLYTLELPDPDVAPFADLCLNARTLLHERQVSPPAWGDALFFVGALTWAMVAEKSGPEHYKRAYNFIREYQTMLQKDGLHDPHSTIFMAYLIGKLGHVDKATAAFREMLQVANADECAAIAVAGAALGIRI